MYKRRMCRVAVGIGIAFIGVAGCGDRSSPDATSRAVLSDAQETVARPLPPDAAPQEKQVYRYLNFEPAGLDFSMTSYQSLGSEFVFERLCMLDPDLRLVPGAAMRWEHAEDGKRWTFHIDLKARWSDGNPVTAHDFAYTFRRLLDPDGGNVYAFFYYDIRGAKAYHQRLSRDPASVGVYATDERTFVIETEKPCAYLPFIVQYPTSSPVPRWQVENYGPRWTEAGKCVTNSAYRLDEWLPGKWMSFGLNPYYAGPNPGRLRKIVRKFTGYVGATSASGGSGLIAYENDEVDLFTVSSPADLEGIRRNPFLHRELWEYDGFATQYLYFRTQTPPFDDLRVRQAFAYAIDREEIVRAALAGAGIPAYTMIAPHFTGYVGDRYKDIQRYDPALARQRLAEAGYPGGKGFPAMELWLSDAAPSSTVYQAAQAIQEKLAAVLGVRIEIRNAEGKTYLRRIYDWEIPLAIGGWGYDYPDPQSYTGVPWRSQPRGFGRQDWTNTVFDGLIDQGAGELDPEKRTQHYEEAERLLAADVGAVFLWHTKVFELRKPRIKGLQLDRWGNRPFRANVSTSFYELYIGEEN